MFVKFIFINIRNVNNFITDTDTIVFVNGFYLVGSHYV